MASETIKEECACGIGDQSDIGHFHESWCPARGLQASDLPERLRAYRPTNEWGDGVHHVICTEAADALEADRAAVAELVEVLQARIDALRTGTIEDEMAIDERIRALLSRHQENSNG